jgi:hypothetical protein
MFSAVHEPGATLPVLWRHPGLGRLVTDARRSTEGAEDARPIAESFAAAFLRVTVVTRRPLAPVPVPKDPMPVSALEHAKQGLNINNVNSSLHSLHRADATRLRPITEDDPVQPELRATAVAAAELLEYRIRES